jgi:osmotically-inducible protein OsmY
MNTTYGLQHQEQTELVEQRILEDEGSEVLDNKGVITLRGTVATVQARETAEAIVRSTNGVSNVINEIDVVQYR